MRFDGFPVSDTGPKDRRSAGLAGTSPKNPVKHLDVSVYLSLSS